MLLTKRQIDILLEAKHRGLYHNSGDVIDRLLELGLMASIGRATAITDAGRQALASARPAGAMVQAYANTNGVPPEDTAL
jgi:hypothetical protein